METKLGSAELHVLLWWGWAWCPVKVQRILVPWPNSLHARRCLAVLDPLVVPGSRARTCQAVWLHLHASNQTEKRWLWSSVESSQVNVTKNIFFLTRGIVNLEFKVCEKIYSLNGKEAVLMIINYNLIHLLLISKTACKQSGHLESESGY